MSYGTVNLPVQSAADAAAALTAAQAALERVARAEQDASDALAAAQAAQSAASAAQSTAAAAQTNSEAAVEAANGASKLYAGSYVGTGNYGQSNPNSITFPFQPKTVILHGIVHDNSSATTTDIYYVSDVAYAWGTEYLIEDCSHTSNTRLNIPVSVSGNTMQWYGNSAHFQRNLSGVTYHYTALG